MTTKLTLTIKQEVINNAKNYASRNGRSLSNIIENYLQTLGRKIRSENILSPKTKKLKGAIKLPRGFDYKKALSSSLGKKYSR